ncbi:MAG: zinc ribbon domain-containing protein [Thermoplasmata archaeon]
MALDILLQSITLQLEVLAAIWVFGCLAIWFIIFILIAVWVYRDAESRGMSGALWLIIVILTGIIGLIVYLVVRSEKRPQYPYAQPPYQPYQQPPAAEAPPAARFCSSCGATLPSGANNCPNCGAKVQ